jgi:coproporphyrinogen III oxidase
LLFIIVIKGRTESILMSLPSTAKWKYDWKPINGSREDLLYKFYLKPQDWAEMTPQSNEEVFISIVFQYNS